MCFSKRTHNFFLSLVVFTLRVGLIMISTCTNTLARADHKIMEKPLLSLILSHLSLEWGFEKTKAWEHKLRKCTWENYAATSNWKRGLKLAWTSCSARYISAMKRYSIWKLTLMVTLITDIKLLWRRFFEPCEKICFSRLRQMQNKHVV